MVKTSSFSALLPSRTNATEYALTHSDIDRAFDGALGTADQVGSLRAGYVADIIAVSEDPLTTSDALEHVRFVMKSGTVYRQNDLPTVAEAN